MSRGTSATRRLARSFEDEGFDLCHAGLTGEAEVALPVGADAEGVADGHEADAGDAEGAGDVAAAGVAAEMDTGETDEGDHLGEIGFAGEIEAGDLALGLDFGDEGLVGGGTHEDEGVALFVEAGGEGGVAFDGPAFGFPASGRVDEDEGVAGPAFGGEGVLDGGEVGGTGDEAKAGGVGGSAEGAGDVHVLIYDVVAGGVGAHGGAEKARAFALIVVAEFAAGLGGGDEAGAFEEALHIEGGVEGAELFDEAGRGLLFEGEDFINGVAEGDESAEPLISGPGDVGGDAGVFEGGGDGEAADDVTDGGQFDDEHLHLRISRARLMTAWGGISAAGRRSSGVPARKVWAFSE